MAENSKTRFFFFITLIKHGFLTNQSARTILSILNIYIYIYIYIYAHMYVCVCVCVTVSFLLCFILYLRAISKHKPPGAYIRRGDFNREFGGGWYLEGLTHGGAYFLNFGGNSTASHVVSCLNVRCHFELHWKFWG